jgi:sortase A
MEERSKNALYGCSFTLTAIALIETSAQALINFLLAPTNASGFLTGARECACNGWLASVRRLTRVMDRQGKSPDFPKGLRNDMLRVRRVELIFLASGLTLLATWGAARFYGVISSKAAIARFEAAEEASLGENTALAQEPFLSSPVDFRFWSPNRVAAYEDSLAKKKDFPLAILRIPKINLEVPVFNGTDELTLNRGVGRILGTARLGASGNLGIAGHRDGFFRGLQSISAGDVLELTQSRNSDQYVVSEIRVVSPDDISVLRRTTVPTVTLVTCFPFYFVGHAPKRYIVTAPLARIGHSGLGSDKETVSMGKNTLGKENKK